MAITAVLSYVVAWGAIVFTERYVRQRPAKSFRAGKKLDSTTMFYLFGALAILIGSPIFSVLGILVYDSWWVGWIGIVVLLAGIAIRVAAMKQLGDFYTRALVVASQQRLVKTGLYKLVRHPGYTGTIIAGLGFSFAQLNWLSLFLTFALLFLIYARRIKTEEAMMLRKFGDEYRVYMNQTKKLLPFIY